jgi:hypothetical protein
VIKTSLVIFEIVISVKRRRQAGGQKVLVEVFYFSKKLSLEGEQGSS